MRLGNETALLDGKTLDVKCQYVSLVVPVTTVPWVCGGGRSVEPRLASERQSLLPLLLGWILDVPT